jgi:hypothetical protein
MDWEGAGAEGLHRRRRYECLAERRTFRIRPGSGVADSPYRLALLLAVTRNETLLTASTLPGAS